MIPTLAATLLRSPAFEQTLRSFLPGCVLGQLHGGIDFDNTPTTSSTSSSQDQERTDQQLAEALTHMENRASSNENVDKAEIGQMTEIFFQHFPLAPAHRVCVWTTTSTTPLHQCEQLELRFSTKVILDLLIALFEEVEQPMKRFE
ncbi:unnamed protein product, partial [Amoebophrya sp. A120]